MRVISVCPVCDAYTPVLGTLTREYVKGSSPDPGAPMLVLHGEQLAASLLNEVNHDLAGPIRETVAELADKVSQLADEVVSLRSRLGQVEWRASR